MSDDDAVDVEVESPDAAADAARTNGTADAAAEEASSDARADGEALAAAVAEHDEALAREVAALEADFAETRDELLAARKRSRS